MKELASAQHYNGPKTKLMDELYEGIVATLDELNNLVIFYKKLIKERSL